MLGSVFSQPPPPFYWTCFQEPLEDNTLAEEMGNLNVINNVTNKVSVFPEYVAVKVRIETGQQSGHIASFSFS